MLVYFYCLFLDYHFYVEKCAKLIPHADMEFLKIEIEEYMHNY